MARERLCKVCGGWHRLDAPWPHNCLPPRNMARADYPVPGFISDGMDAVRSMLDGRMYDSKSALRATYRAAGVTEVGNDSSVTNPKPFEKPKPDRKAIQAAVGKAIARVNLTT